MLRRRSRWDGGLRGLGRPRARSMRQHTHRPSIQEAHRHTTVPTSVGEEEWMAPSQGWESTKRGIYLGALAFAVPTIPFVMVLRWDVEPLLRLTYPVLLLVLLALFVGLLTNRIAASTAERAVLIVVPTLWVVRMAAVLYLQPDLSVAAAVVNQSIGPGFVILAIVAYLALPARTGLALAGGFVLGSTVVVLPRVIEELLRAGPTSDVIGLLRVGVTTGVSVALLYALAALKEQVATAQAHAETNAALARTDQLTGLLNRRAILERLQALSALSERHSRPLTLAVVDLDHFKRVNDAAGHLAGDDVLRAVAEVMADEVRDSDVIGRWGGDELLVVLPETEADAAAATMRRVLDRVRREVRASAHQNGGGGGFDGPPVTLSVGIAERTPDDDQDRLLSRADHALYRAKEGGRDRVVIDRGERAHV